MEESVTVEPNSWLQDAVKKGAILAIIHIIVFLIIYYAFPAKLTGLSYAAFIIFFNLGYCFVNARQRRAELGGYVDFGVIFKYVFVLLAASGLIQMIFNAVFLFVEPSFPEVMAQSQLDTSLYWAQKFGAPDEALDQMTDEFDREEIAERFTFSGQLFGFGIGLLFYALGAVIVGLIVRKRQPEQF